MPRRTAPVISLVPRLTRRATWLFDMVNGSGYAASVVQLRHAIRLSRPATTVTVCRRPTTLAGKGEADWGASGDPDRVACA